MAVLEDVKFETFGMRCRTRALTEALLDMNCKSRLAVHGTGEAKLPIDYGHVDARTYAASHTPSTSIEAFSKLCTSLQEVHAAAAMTRPSTALPRLDLRPK